MNCKNCNNQINEGEKFCRVCGQPQEIQQNNKKKKIDKKIIVGVILVILLAFVIINKFSKKQESIMNLEYEFLTITEDSHYIINGADKDIAFKVTEGTTFKIYDETGKEIKANIKDSNIVSKEYEKGKTYKIKIENGNFESEQLKKTNELTFKIARDEVKEYKLNENVQKAKKENTKVENNMMETNATYSTGDVVTIFDGEALKEAYVVLSKLDGKYLVTEATIDNIYKELDFYYEEYADLSNYETQEGIKQYLTQSAKNSSWYEAIVETVHAEPKIEINLKNVDDGIEAEIKIKISSGDNSTFLKSEYHDFEFSYKQTVQVKTLVDITKTNWDISMQIMTSQGFGFKVSNTLIDYDGTKNKEWMSKIQNAINEKQGTDKDEKEIDVVTIPIVTPVPGLTIDVELSLINEVGMSIDFETNLSLKNSLAVSIDYGVGEKFKASGASDFEVEEATFGFSGTLEMKTGVKISGSVSLVGALKVGLGGTVGMYGESKTSILSDLVAQENTLKNESELGGFANLSVEFGVLMIDGSIEVVEVKIPFFKDGWEYKETYDGEKINIITFDSDGGSEVETQKLLPGEKVQKPENPTKEGYVFDYWDLYGTEYNFDDDVTSSLTLKAIWKEAESEEDETVSGQPDIETPSTQEPSTDITPDNNEKDETPEIDNSNKPSNNQISSEAQTSINYDDKIAFIDHDSSSDEEGNKYTYIAIIYYKNGEVVGVGIKLIFEEQKAAEEYYNKNKLNSSDSSVVKNVSLENNILYFEPVDISSFSFLTKDIVIFTCTYSTCEIIK